MLAQESYPPEYYVSRASDRPDLEKKYINDYKGMIELWIVLLLVVE